MDLGLYFFKKYIGMVSAGMADHYTNKSRYSPPEVLASKGQIIDKPNESGDVYSFALIAW